MKRFLCSRKLSLQTQQTIKKYFSNVSLWSMFFSQSCQK